MSEIIFPSEKNELNIVIGPMFSGKTTLIINKFNELYKTINDEKSEDSYVVVNHTIDIRYDNNKICSHDGIKIDSITTNKLELIYEKLEKSKYIFIDEAQFYDDLYTTIKKLLFDKKSKNGKIIWIAGLDGDFKQEPFAKSKLLDLIPYSSRTIKLTASCYICKTMAPFSKRLLASNDVILVGGSDKYQPVCINHLV
jgi:thymidine kinase